MFDWELDVWAEFSSSLEDVKIQRFMSDSIVWSFYSKGLFSISYFRRCVEDLSDDVSHDIVSIWYGYCPPKVEIFVWQLLRGRIMVRGLLNRFSVNLSDDILCPMCG